MKRIKVYLYGPFSSKVEGGFERMNSNIVNAFENDDSIIVVPFPMLRMKLKGIFKYALYPLFYIYSFFSDILRLLYFILTDKPDILHMTSLYRYFIARDALVGLLARIFGIRLVFDIRAGSFINIYNDSPYKFIYRFCFAISSVILAEGRKYVDFLDKIGYNAKYLPNCTEIDTDKTTSEYKYAGTTEFVYIGRIIPEKGIEDSISVLKALHEKHNAALHFTIIGTYQDSYYRFLLDRYGRFVKERVEFAGYKTRDELNSILEKADFFMFLTTWRGEGHSNALNEAMSCGVPVFFYDTGFTREIIQNDSYLLTPGDKEANAVKILETIKNADAVNLEKGRLIRLITDEYSIGRMKTMLSSVYLEILQEKE